MSTVIHERVRNAQNGKDEGAIIRLKSGWVVMAKAQVLEGYCLLLPDPVVPSLNSLSGALRAQYCLDMIQVGDALLHLTRAVRINYETLCNADPALHTHIIPRYKDEPEDRRTKPIFCGYDWNVARPFNKEKDGELMQKIRDFLQPFA